MMITAIADTAAQPYSVMDIMSIYAQQKMKHFMAYTCSLVDISLILCSRVHNLPDTFD